MELLRASTRHPAMPEDAQNLVDRTMNPEREAVTEQRKTLVRTVLEELPEKDRRILRAVFLEDTDKSEVCARFDVNRDYLRVLVHRAKIRFRDALDRGGRNRT
jgi:RNA polymerase sigma-70 factor (ECF subfamily)